MANDTLPAYLESTLDANTILQTMLSQVPSDIDTSQGGFMWDALSPASIQMALGAWMAQQVLQLGFAKTTYGPYLDMKGAEAGIPRNQAVSAIGQITIVGTAGTVIPAGTRVSTTATSSAPAVFFDTSADATIGEGGSVTIDVVAEAAGTAGNVPAGAITLLGQPVDGVTSITNPAATSGGADEETDADYLARYLQVRQNPSAGGNKADYIKWALEVEGVGGVSVVPVRDGPGTVSIAIIDTDKRPADQTLIDAVQNYIAPPWVNAVYAYSMTTGSYGVSVDASTKDGSGNSTVKMVYNASGTGILTNDIKSTLQKPGIWQARVTVKVDSTAGSADLLQIGVWDVAGNTWCKTSPSDNTDAMVTFKASDLTTAWQEQVVTFYWNGTDDIELKVTRLQTDTTTNLWVDYSIYRSTFSQDTGGGKAPIGATVTVEAAGTVTIAVVSQASIANGYDAATVESNAEASIAAYLQSIAFQDDNTVNYVRVGQAILDTAGVSADTNLTVNGGTGNVAVGVQDVAVLGTVTWS